MLHRIGIPRAAPGVVQQQLHKAIAVDVPTSPMPVKHRSARVDGRQQLSRPRCFHGARRQHGANALDDPSKRRARACGCSGAGQRVRRERHVEVRERVLKCLEVGGCEHLRIHHSAAFDGRDRENRTDFPAQEGGAYKSKHPMQLGFEQQRLLPPHARVEVEHGTVRVQPAQQRRQIRHESILNRRVTKEKIEILRAAICEGDSGRKFCTGSSNEGYSGVKGGQRVVLHGEAVRRR